MDWIEAQDGSLVQVCQISYICLDIGAMSLIKAQMTSGSEVVLWCDVLPEEEARQSFKRVKDRLHCYDTLESMTRIMSGGEYDGEKQVQKV
ncbi:MAG: hypothetical protein KAS32_29095 [Candidatus Peribacteraceae bacterium]|nr:hypothetical protein [Candidatus Peribacteraceae bacterium]